ncbi:IucA/IucC family protein [Paenibacillus sp. PL91]|uniref:IucA/IucC family protein n=1 Tax=Paenibacillus sp. PL91 TaxID=2729538 RepID=UPI00145C6692|nr:IucA/IucC family protein [Paenibacillus sp. PL91]MBC9202355.1 siderophore biosynthesis protein [Paenibacillus sp. PL91]
MLLLQAYRVNEAIRSPIYNQVTERVVRQLLESLLYEQIVSPQLREEGKPFIFTLNGLHASGKRVVYVCKGRRTMTFGRIRIAKHSIIRMVEGVIEPITHPGQLLIELLPESGSSGEESHIAAMAKELEQTRLNDVLAQYERMLNGRPLIGLSFDELEAEAMDGHPYHPCYKSRMGFHYEQNYEYGPEFKQPVFPLWVAIDHSIAFASIDVEMSYGQLLLEELGEGQRLAFQQVLLQQDCVPADYVWLPVHPWQWMNKIVPAFTQELHSKQLVLLGSSTYSYNAQQSIRTLSNAVNPKKASVKLSLHIRNTSSYRYLTPHSVASAPAVSHWLSKLAEADPYLKQEARLVILKEYAGVTYEAKSEEAMQYDLLHGRYGALGCIWRESIHSYLEEGEQAVPFHALYALDSDQRPFIDAWIDQHGLENWLRHLLEASMLPIVQLLVMHGIALESHAQNMILIHHNGLPVRTALKDFHEGVEYCNEDVTKLVPLPNFSQIHPVYAQGKLDDYYEMKERSSLVAMTLDAFFMINLGELALMLSDNYGYEEQDFWQLAAAIMEAHEARYPDEQERFVQFDLYAPSCIVEQLAGNRLYAAAVERNHTVANPLHLARKALAQAGRGEGLENNGKGMLSYAAVQSR